MIENRNLYGVEFQCDLIRLMMIDPAFCTKACFYLKETFFTGDMRWFFRKAKDYYEEFKICPTAEFFQTMVLGQTDLQTFEDLRGKIMKATPLRNVVWIKKEVTGFIRANLFISTYTEASQFYNAGHKDTAYETVDKRVSELLKMSFEEERVSRFGDHAIVLDKAAQQSKDAVPTGIIEIDKAMQGGLMPQTWTTFLGGSNSGKCVAFDTPVPSARGLIPINEMRVGDRVIGINGERVVLGVHANGKKTVWKTTLKNGQFIESTKDHVHAVMTRSGPAEKPLSEIKIGDFLIVPRGMWQGKKTIDSDVAWLLGFTFGDGSYLKRKSGMRNLNWTVSHGPFLDKLCRILRERGCTPRIYSRKKCAMVWGNMAIANLLESYGFLPGTRQNKTFIDLWLWDATSVSHFVAGLMDADGTMNHTGTGIVLVLKHEKAIRTLHQILLRMGIFSSVKKRSKTVRLPKKTLENYEVFQLTIGGANIERFLALVPLSDKWGDGRFQKRPTRGGVDHVFVTDKIKSKIREAKKRTSRKTVSRKFLDHLKVDFVQDFFISPVVSVEREGVKETFDLSVDQDNLYVANGILTHNSMLGPSLAYSAAEAGKRTFVTIHEDEEVPTKLRYLSRFSGLPINKLVQPRCLLTPDEVKALELADKSLADHVVLRFMYGAECFLESVCEAVRMLKSEWDFHLYICDYGQCLKVKSIKNMDNTYAAQGFIYQELKQLCLELSIAGAGGAQVNRQAHKMAKSGSDFIRGSDVGDSFEIYRKASNVITMNRSNDDARMNRIVYLLDKVRNGRCPVAVECVTDYARAATHFTTAASQVEIQVEDGPQRKEDDE